MNSRVREPSRLSLWGRALYSFLRRAAFKRLGKDIEPLKVYAHHPRISFAHTDLTMAVQGGLLDPRLKTLVFLRASALIGCPF